MRNIKNLKDPTNVAAALGWLLLLWQAAFAGPAAAQLAKVGCIAHDTKITCDCHNEPQAMQLPQLQGAVYQVEIRNCRGLVVNANALIETEGLGKIYFNQVDQLVLNKYALSMPRYASNKALIVEFEQVNIQLIDSHAINGNIDEISFVNGRIESIQPFGITTTKDSAILLKLDGVTLQRIEGQAFKKFAVEKMVIANCHFLENVPTRAFYELEVLNELSIHNNQFQELHSHAFNFKLISKLSLTDNRFAGVHGEWLEAHIRDAIALRGNNFGNTSDIAFRSLAVHRDYLLSERLELRFHNNTVRTPSVLSSAGRSDAASTAQPLSFNARFALSVQQLRYDNAWSCEALDMQAKPPQPRAEFFRLHSEQLYLRDSHLPAPGAEPQFVQLRQLISDQCLASSYLAYIIAGGVLLLLLLLLVVVLLLWCRVQRRRRKRKMDVVQPEPRTYKETQIVYQIENASLIKTDF